MDFFQIIEVSLMLTPGMERATSEDLAFAKRSSRESDNVGRRVCIELVRKRGNSGEETLNSVDEEGKACELRSRREERLENGVKNPTGARLFQVLSLPIQVATYSERKRNILVKRYQAYLFQILGKMQDKFNVCLIIFTGDDMPDIQECPFPVH